MVLFIICEKKNKENPLTQARDIFDLVRLCVFRPANVISTHKMPYYWNVLYTQRTMLEMV